MKITAAVSSGEPIYVGRCCEKQHQFLIITQSALEHLAEHDEASYHEAVAMIPELWGKEWDWEHPYDRYGNPL